MSVTTEDKPLVGANSTELFSDRNTTKKFDFTTETTSLFPNDPPASEHQKTTLKNTLGKLLQPKFRQSEEKSPSKENNFKGSLSELDNDKKGTISLTSADKIPIPKDEPDSLVIDNLSPIKRDPEHIKQQVSRNLLQKPTVKKNAWRSLLSLDEPKAKSISANVSGSSTPKSGKVAKVDKIRRKSTQDCRNLIQEMQKEEENGKSSSKKPGSNFTLEHFSLLRKQIENEKQRLAEDIKEAVEEKEKKESVLSLSETSSRKWEKAKTNVLALARLKRLKDDLRLWGSNMHMTGQTAEQKNLKMLIPENQFDNNAPQKKNKRFMVYPQSTQNKFYNAWQTIYGLCMLYTAFITPYRIGFLTDLPLWWIIFEQVIDVLFLCDVIITLNTALVLENGQIIDSRRAIFLNYLKGWLIMDIVAIVPYSLFMDSADGNGNDYSDLVKFVRLPRLYKVVRFAKVFKVMKRIKRNKYFQNIQDSLKINISTLRMINFLLILLLSVHVFACLWFFAAKFYRFTPGTWVYELGLLDESNVSLYITSVYWVVSTLTTVGFGDVHAFNDFERLLSIFWIVIGVGFYSLNIGAMTSLLANKDTREGNLAAKLVLMDEFAKETNLPKELRLKIKRALEYNSLRNVFNQFERNEFFDEIPIDVKSEMAEVMHRGVITKLKFFKNKDRVFIATMVPLLQPLKVTKGELIYRTGEYPINIYFIISGRVNIVVGAHMLNLKTYVQGSYFGEIEMVNNTIRQSTIRAEMDCELLTLSRKAFLRLMEDFPNYHDELKLIAEERQLRIAEALRKIKQLLPIASTSKFWEKKRQHSLYDLDEVNRIQEFGSNDRLDEKPFSMKQAGRLAKQQTLKFAKANNLGPKIDEEENEDDDEEARVSIPRQILEDREAKGKIANLINAEELKEEENKIAKMISQMQNSRASPDGNKLVNDQNSQLTQTQLNTKLMQAEGDSKKKKAVLIVKGTSNNPKPITAVENVKPVNSPVSNAAIQAKRHSHSFSASADKSFHSNTSNSPVHEGDKKTVNRRSYFFRRSQNFESVMPMRRSITAKAKVNKIVPKPKTGLFNKIFDSQKTESKKKNPSLEDFEGKPEEKIDILEIPAKVIRNFNKNARSNSLEKAASNPRSNEASDPYFLKIKSTPNMGFPDNRPPEEKLENSIALDPNLCDSGEESSNPGSKPKRNNYDETPKKVLMVSGTNFERKKNRTNTATSLTSNEEDEIPDIAMCLVGPGEINKNFRLNIYDAPNNKFNTEKAFSNFWGSSSPKGRDEKAIDNNQAELLRRRRDDLQDYKINIIAPKSSSKLEDSGLIQKDKISLDVSRDGSSSQRGKTPAEEEIIKPESNKLQLSYDLQRKNSIEIVKTQASQALSKNRLTSQSSLKLIKTTGNQNLSRQTSLRVLKSEPTQSVAFLKPPVADKSNSSLDPKSDQATGAIRTDQSLSRLSILSSDLKNSKFLDSFTSQDLNLEGEGHKSVDMDQKDLGLSVIMSEEQQEAQESVRENSMRRSDKTKSLKVDTPRDTDWKNLTPPPIVKDVSWKRSQTAPDQGMEFGEETAKFSEKKVDTAKSLKKSEEKNKERDRARKREKAEQGNYKEKYKKQKRYIKELLSGFKDLRKDFGGMQKDVGSIQARLDTFETLVGNLQGLIAKFAEKVKDQKKGSKSSRKSPSIERTIENNETSNSDLAGGTVVSQNMSPATATVYMPQKKTIVFSFQKPEAKVKKFGKQEEHEQSEKPEIKELQASFRDSSLFYNDDSMPSPIRQKPDEIQMKPVQPENKPKPDMRRIPKLKGTISKAGFQVLNKDKYASDEEGNSFINTNYEDPESKIS